MGLGLLGMEIARTAHGVPFADARVLESATVELVSASGHPRTIPLPLVTLPGCGEGLTCLGGDATEAGLHVHFALGPGARALPLSATLEITKPSEWRRVAVRLQFAADAMELLGRDYRPTRAKKAILDRFDPKWIALRHKNATLGALLLDPDADSVVATVEHDRVVVDLELFSVEARPFAHLPRCGKVWRDIHGQVPMRSRWLKPGDHFSATGELLLGDSTPLALSPWPDGRLAALSITDHADQSTSPTLHALLAGNEHADLDHPDGGLHGHGIAITKALFLHGVVKPDWSRAQLDDPKMVLLADRMRAAGSEVVPHSATPHTDVRDVSEAALAWFGARGAHVWIDHQPQTNCEGFGQSGWHTTTGIADLLERHHFRDVWDLEEWTGRGLDQRDPAHLDRRAATVWPLGRLEPGGPASLWLFRSTWDFIPTRAFYTRYGEPELDKLEKSRGIHVAHTYLETLHAPGTMFGRRNLLYHARDGHIALKPRFQAWLAALQRRSARGTLWVAPIGAIGDRMRALAGARLRVSENGDVVVHVPPGADGLTLQLVGAGALAGDGLLSQRAVGDSMRAWMKPCAVAEGCDVTLARSPR